MAEGQDNTAVYAVWESTWYDVSDNGRDDLQLLGIYATKELAISAAEKRGKEIFGEDFNYEEYDKQRDYYDENEDNSQWGMHTDLYCTKEAVQTELREHRIYGEFF